MKDEGTLDSFNFKTIQNVSGWMILYAMFLQLKG